MNIEDEIAAGVFVESTCLFCGHTERPPSLSIPTCCEKAMAVSTQVPSNVVSKVVR